VGAGRLALIQQFENYKIMKTKQILLLLALTCIIGLMTGCETGSTRAASTDQQFPPAPITSANAPDNNADGINK
jgi:hypothetical protein